MKKHLSIQDFNVCIKECKDKSKLQKMEAIFLYRIEKKSAKEVALHVGTTVNNVYQWAHKYKKYGVDAFEQKQRGGRRQALMTLEEENSILDQIVEDSNKGLIVVAAKVQKLAEEKSKKPLFKNYAYELLERHGWRKVKPRPKNPKSSREVRETFKKELPAAILKISQSFNPQDKRPLLVLSEDEARFGRISIPRVCWAPRAIRPIVTSQLVRQFLYVFTVVDPLSGSNFSVIFSDADTVMMNIFLTEISNHYKDYRVIIIADQAAWHKSKGLKQFDNIRFLFLPPGSPELNPTEHIWEHIREKYLANRTFDSIECLQNRLIEVLKEIYLHPESIQSLVSFSWMKVNFND